MSRYGPHRAEDAPTTVLVHSTPEPGRRVEQHVPLPAALVKQRRDLNNLAWEARRCPSSS